MYQCQRSGTAAGTRGSVILERWQEHPDPPPPFTHTGYTCIMCMHRVDICVGTEEQSQVLFSKTPSTSIVTGSLTVLNLTTRLGWEVSEPRGSSCFCLPSAGTMGMHTMMVFLHRCWGVKLSLMLSGLYQPSHLPGPSHYFKNKT